VGAFERLKLESKLEGAGTVAGVSMGYNPFGEAEHYLGVYDAYLRIDEAGKYGFCTASDDGSFVLIDEKLVTQWPGGHGVWEGSRGEHNGTVELGKGVHHVRYLHDAGVGENVAFLGWKPPGRERFEPIPSGQYTAVRGAKAGEPEAQGKQVRVFPSARVLTSLWVPESSREERKQLTLVELSAAVANGKDAKVTWELGDGLMAEGATVKHVYARLGEVSVKVRVEAAGGGGGKDELTFPLRLAFQDAQAPGVTQGSEQEYAELAGKYDFGRWDLADLKRYLEMLIRGEHYARVPGPGLVYAERNAGDGEMVRQIAGVMVTPRAYDAGAAVGVLARLPEGDTGSLARRASLLALVLDRADEAEGLVKKAMAQAKTDGERRAALIAEGDVAVARSAFDKAAESYRKAEALTPRKRTDPSVMAKLGTYPWAVEDYTARQELVEAFDTLAEWEENFPSQKLESTSFLMRGKVLYVAEKYGSAARFFDLCYRVSPDGPNAPEALWLRASSLHQMKKFEEALQIYELLQTQFTRSEYAAKLGKRMEQARKKEGL
jgi:TolA-binding protein